MTDAEIITIAESLGWRREGSLWREPKGGKRWCWTLDQLLREIEARKLFNK